MASARYLDLVAHLREKREALSVPLRLPDEHTLARERGVARDTVRRALSVLEKEEAIVRRPRRGTYLQPLKPQVESLGHQAIGFVPPWWADSTTAWHTSTVFEGISRWADERHCHISVLHAKREMNDEDDWIATVQARRLAGLIWLSPQSQQMPLIRRLAQLLPVVVVGRYGEGSHVYSVSPDYEMAARLLDEHLVGLGHEKYGVIGTDIMGTYSQTWIKSIEAAYARRGRCFDHRELFLDIKPFPRNHLPDLLELMMSGRPWLRAFLLTTSSYLKDLLESREFRDRIGNQITLATFDLGTQSMSSYWPGFEFDHVRCDWPAIGREAANFLGQLILDQPVPAQRTLPVTFVDGQSSAPAQEGRKVELATSQNEL